MSGIKVIVDNRKARHDYHLIEKFEAGIALQGSEVKSLRNGQCHLKDSFIDVQNGELYLVGAHISPYHASSYNNHEPERKRKLLMHRNQIDKLDSHVRTKGHTLVPTKLYFKNGRIKVELALARGKQQHDKRQAIKKREANREMASRMKHRR